MCVMYKCPWKYIVLNDIVITTNTVYVIIYNAVYDNKHESVDRRAFKNDNYAVLGGSLTKASRQ